MDNKEEKNIPQVDDFEIIDIPMNNESEINDNINIANDISELEQPVVIEDIHQEPTNQTVENSEMIDSNNVFESEIVEEQPIFGAAQMSPEVNQNMDYTSSYNEINSNLEQTSFNEISQQLQEINQQQIENNNDEENIDLNISDNYNTNPQMNLNENTDIGNINQRSNSTLESSNVYVPKREVKNEQKLPKEKMDKNLKEIIIMGIIVAIVIMSLPTLYNLSTGKYHIISNIKNAFGGISEKKEEQSTSTEEQNTSTNKETETVEEEIDEETKEDTNQNTVTFDFSAYNNQVIDSKTLTTLLNNYSSNIISLSPTTENGKQVFKIEIAKDVASADYSISNPEQALESFSKQYLSDNSNYLINVGSVNDNIIVLSATKQ